MEEKKLKYTQDKYLSSNMIYSTYKDYDLNFESFD